MTESRSDILTRLLAETDWLARMARALTASDDLAADVTQETWLTALRSPPRHSGSPRGWLATVARRVASRMARTDGRRNARERKVSREVASPDPARLTARVEMQRRVADAVLSLDEPYRSVVVMRYFEDRSSVEIAAALSILPATVRTRLHRALRILRGRLDDEHRGGRRAWLAVLLPIADGGPGPATATTGLILIGGLLMSTKTLLGTVAVIVLAVTLAVTGVINLGPESPPPAPNSPTGIAAATVPVPVEFPVAPVPAAPPDPADPKQESERGATALRGRLVDPNSAPVTNARVYLTFGPGETVSGGRAGKDGTFLVVVPAGSGKGDLVVDAPGYLPLIRPVSALLDAAETKHELVLDPGLSITGTVQDETGRPVKTAFHAVRLDAARGQASRLSRHSPFRARTLGFSNETGRFELLGLAPGPYRIEKATTNYRAAEGSTVTCDAGATGVTIVLYRTVALTLRIHHVGTDLPVKDKVGWSLFAGGKRARSGGTSSGRPVIRGLPAGRFRLEVTAPNYEPFSLTIDLSLDASPVTADVPLTRTGAHGFGTLSGTVVNAEAKADQIPEFRVLVSEFGGIFGFKGRDDGRFEIRRVPAGVYHLRAVSKDGSLASRCEEVEVAAGDRRELRLRLEPAGRVVLRVANGELCEEPTVEFRLYVGDGLLIARFTSSRNHHPTEGITLASLAPGLVGVVAVSRGRVLGRTEVSVTAGRDAIAELSLLRTAEGASSAPDAPPLRPRPSTASVPPAPPAPPREESASARVAGLIEKLESRESRTRFDAVVELGKLGDAAPIRALTHVVENDPDLFVRRTAIRALGGLGRRALSAVPAIAQAVADKSSFVADAATIAIAEITGQALPYHKGMTKEEIAAAAEKLVAEVSEERPR